MNTIGQNIRLTFFGESHSEFMGIVIDNLPAGLKLDLDLIRSELKKRRPDGLLSTARIEPDDFQIVSGYHAAVTTGTPLTFIIKNIDVNSSDYEYLKTTPRPSHADYPASVKYDGANDHRGGGMFSGRLTALWMIAGAIAKQILNGENIHVGSHIQSVKDVEDYTFDKINVNNELLKTLENSAFPVLNQEISAQMAAVIAAAKAKGDSVGGSVETAITNLPAGLGEPLFLSFESHLSQALFSVPAVKAIEFGSGFSLASMYGSEANDQYYFSASGIRTTTNHNGGILGGLTTGMPVIFRVAIKPTPSIAMKQRTVDLIESKDVDLTIKGRHDPAIVQRAVHVINAVAYFITLDLLSISRLSRRSG